MTFEHILSGLESRSLKPEAVKEWMSEKEQMKKINFYVHYADITKEPMKDTQLQELRAIGGILQALYDSSVGSVITDSEYDSIQELLVDEGIPRTTKSVELNDLKKVSHSHTRLRGSMSKIYYLFPDEPRTNKSRKSLDEWIKSQQIRYQKVTGKSIDLNEVKVLVQPKFDGCSTVLECDEQNNHLWITRGDTSTNLGSDISRVMNQFNDALPSIPGGAQQFETMISEQSKDRINEFYQHHPYRDSRQIVISIFNTNEPDFKIDFLHPIPLRIIGPEDELESIHPLMLKDIPTTVCKFGDRDTIKEFANSHRYVQIAGHSFRTDGAVMTILDANIRKALGRENNVNNYEVAYKFTEEVGKSRVKDVEFYISEFGHITPVVVVNDVILKGKNINHISIANKERFDELNLHVGDEVRVHYDIIPYVTLDVTCQRAKNGRRIEFIRRCPACHEELDLDVVEVQCHNPDCPSRIMGRILNYCRSLRIANIGYSTIETLYDHGLLKHGIRSLYKLKKYTMDIRDLEGFGRQKTKKMISEIEAKRNLDDFEFFGAIGIEDLGMKTFQAIFQKIPLDEFVNMIKLKNWELFNAKLVTVPGMGSKKAELLTRYYKIPEHRSELLQLLKEVRLRPTYQTGASRGRIVFSKCRPTSDEIATLRQMGYNPSDSWSNQAICLVVPSQNDTSHKIEKAREKRIPIIALDGRSVLDALKAFIA